MCIRDRFALGITFSSSMALPYVQIKFYDVFREATQASNNELGLLMTIFTAVSMALYIPGGVLADRGSPKKLLLLSLIMMCGLNAYFAFHTSYGAAQLIWALLAIAANTVQWPTLILSLIHISFLHFDGTDALLVTGKQRGVYPFHFPLNLRLIKGR